MKLPEVPRGAFCTHPRAKLVACPWCRKRGIRVCAVECRDCGLGWMLNEGDLGYYDCLRKHGA